MIIHTYIHIYIYIYMYVCMYVCMYVYVYVCTCKHSWERPYPQPSNFLIGPNLCEQKCSYWCVTKWTFYYLYFFALNLGFTIETSLILIKEKIKKKKKTTQNIYNFYWYIWMYIIWKIYRILHGFDLRYNLRRSTLLGF